MTKPVLIFFIILLMSAKSLILYAQIPPDLSAGIDSIFADVDNDRSPGAAVLIVKDGEVIFNKGYGMANLETAIPVTSTTVFDIASLSKQFTGMAISMLIEEGRLSEEDDIRKYLPVMAYHGDIITISHLLHHTSGIRDWTGTLSLAGVNIHGIVTFDQVLRMAYNQKELNFPPGTEHSYSNTNYNLLARIIQRVTGESFPIWMMNNIFSPLRMNDTHFRDDRSAIIKNNATGYFMWKDSLRTVSDNLTAVGSSALHTTTKDIGKWLINLHDPIVGNRSVIDRMFKPGTLNNGDQVPYSFGFDIDEYRGYRKLHHSGGWVAFSTHLAYFPEEDLSVAILNNYPANTYSDILKITDLFLAEKLDNINKSKPKAKKLRVRELRAYVGTYRFRPGLYMEISQHNNTLLSQSTNEAKVPITAISATTFWVGRNRSNLEFLTDNKGKITGLNYMGRNAVKIELQKLDPEQLKEFTGNYFSEELSIGFTVERQSEGLILKNNFHNIINLDHIWKDDFRGDKWFASSVEFIRNEKGEVTGFLVADVEGRSRGQRFIKINLPE
jgi:CubicO group peptidase (beta-lactamase class C family)